MSIESMDGTMNSNLNYSDSDILRNETSAVDAVASGNFSSNDMDYKSSIFNLHDKSDEPDVPLFDTPVVDEKEIYFHNGNVNGDEGLKKAASEKKLPLPTKRSVDNLLQKDNDEKEEDPSVEASRRIWGHGVFLCAECAKAHVLLGSAVTIVRNVQEMSSWTPEEAAIMKQAGGNTTGWKIYEAFLPESWQRRRPNHASSVLDRLTFCRAKYEALAFILPPTGGPLCDQAWRNIINRHRFARWAQTDPRNPAGDIRNLYALSLTRQSESSRKLAPNGGLRDVHPGGKFVLPSRLVDYFCVVKSSGFLHPSVLQERNDVDLSTLPGPEDVSLEPRVIDCYPSQDSHPDLEFPEHVATFVLPEGCRPSDRQISPKCFTFVLTSASGHRLYGTTLKLYDEAIETTELRDIMEKSGYKGEFPPWLAAAGRYSKQQEKSSSFSVDSSGHSSDYMDIVYLPKCLVVLSHYPFFDLFRNFLLQLYRITLVEAPLPIERFIANFCCEVPLPPQGKVEVKFGFTVKDIWSIQRPPQNKLPLANFSFKPLFASLSAGNIMVVVACLMLEHRVALCSSQYPLLGPVSEALLSFLFPLQWQGIYIPVMPYSMLDILDAPVPFVVGLHARYLAQFEPSMRPHGVVFVDLDKDVVHLGYDEDSNTPRAVPALPDKGALKLRQKLEEFGSCVYLHEIESSTENRTITTGEAQPLPDYKREAYAVKFSASLPNATTPFGNVGGANMHGEDPRLQRPKVRRKFVLRTTDKAYQENELLTPITGFLSEQGQLYDRENAEPVRNLAAKKTGGFFRRLRSQQSFSQEDNARGPHLFDLQEVRQISRMFDPAVFDYPFPPNFPDCLTNE